jgi:uncharacterized protein YdaT
MAWTKNHYPDEFKSLSPYIREKAIELVNDLIAGGMSEHDAIAVTKQQVEHLQENFEVAVKHTGESRLR